MKTLDQQIDELAARVDRNILDRRSPESWHAEKNDIWVEMRRLARKIRSETGRRPPSTTWRSSNGR